VRSGNLRIVVFLTRVSIEDCIVRAGFATRDFPTALFYCMRAPIVTSFGPDYRVTQTKRTASRELTYSMKKSDFRQTLSAR